MRRRLGHLFVVLPVGTAFVVAPPARAAPKNGISAQSISLPSGPGSIEGLGESFEPQLNTGTASYAVAFELPPGRAGQTPSLGLSYNGGSGNGVLGIGWSLSGVAAVQRQADKGLPLYDESPDFNGSDTFLASGEELVPLSDGSFRTENEGSFIRYRFDRDANTWTAEMPDGSKLLLGVGPDSRVEDGSRTAKWCGTRIEDTNGNRVEYEYTTFPDSPGQIYLSGLAYNRHASETPAAEHVVKLTYEPTTRPDPVSDFRFGFEVMTARRLARVDVCTRGAGFSPASTCDDVGVSEAARVRAYRLAYDEVGACQGGICSRGLSGNACDTDADCTAGVTRLAEVVQIGDDNVSTLPPLRFTYTELELFTNPEWSPVPGFPTGALGSPEAALVDLDADALPDVIESPAGQPGTLRRALNQGVGEDGLVSFSPFETIAGPTERLSTPGTQLADLDGDGITDLLSRPSAATAVFELRRGTGAGRFADVPLPFQVAGLDDFSAQGFEDPKLRLVDLDFDKRIDVLRSETDVLGTATGLRLRLTQRIGGGDFLGPAVDCAPLPGVDFANRRSFLVDMNGDRLLDVVRVDTTPERVSRILYWPASGRGAYGRAASCVAQGQGIVLGGAPVAALPSADFLGFRGFHWQDLTNDGLADLLWTGPTSMTAWINVGGDRLRRVELGPYPDGIDFDRCDPETGCNPQLFDVIEFGDLNGNGTTDVLHVDRDTNVARFLDIVGVRGAPPNLLRTVDNGIGGVTTIDYAPSTVFDIAERTEGGMPWRTRSPFPVTVVVRKTIRFGLDLDGAPGEDEYVTEYRYRDAFYDGVEKEFRGFAEVAVIQRGDASQPTGVTRHHFHTGGADGVDNDGDGAVDERSEQGGAEEESLKGLPLEVRQETCPDGPDGACRVNGEVFQHDLRRWEVRTLYGATGRVCSGNVEVGCCSDTDCTAPALGGRCVEGGTPEPGLFDERACVAGKSVHWAVATAERSAVIERGAEPRLDRMTEMDYDGFGNHIARRQWGIVSAAEPPPFGCLLATGTCDDPSNRPCGSDRDCASGTCSKISVADASTCPTLDPFAFMDSAGSDDERFEAMLFGINEADWLLRCESEMTVADEHGSIEAHSRSFYDSLALGQCAKGNLTRSEKLLSDESRFIPRVRNQYDVFGNVVERRDARGNRRTFSFDASLATYPVAETVHLDGYTVGMTASYHEGFGVIDQATTWGVSAPGPVYRYGYDPFARLVSVVQPGDTDAAPTLTYAYHLNEQGDGLNRVVTRRRETVGGGSIDSFAYLDGLGRPLGTKAEGDAPDAWIFEGAKGYGRRGTERATWLPYLSATRDYEAPDPGEAQNAILRDELGRVVRAIRADGRFVDTRYVPLGTDEFDENDTSGLTLDSHASLRQDGLERLRSVAERNRGEVLRTRYAYDARHNLVEVLDAQDNRTTFAYDSLSRQVRLSDPDRGSLRNRYDDTDNLVETRDAKGQRIVMTYDRANRLASENYLDQTGDPGTDPVDVVYAYDRPAPGGIDLGDGSVEAATFTAGELAFVRDLSGETHISYDARRREIVTAKRVRDPRLQVLVPYATRFEHDSADRLTGITYPDGDRVIYRYGSRGLLQQIAGAGGGQELLKSVHYRPSGQPAEVVFGNDVRTEHTYDARLRLVGLRTSGAGASGGRDLLHYRYDLDPVSNVRAIEDLRAEVPPGTPRHNTQRLAYDGLHRLVTYRLSAPSDPSASFGTIEYAYDKIGNLLLKTSDIEHRDRGRSVTHLGMLSYGGSGGRSGREGREPGDPPGPHAISAAGSGSERRLYRYDDNGNMAELDGLAAEWDFKDRLVALEGDAFRAEYVYDYSDRRITKKVTSKGSFQGMQPGDSRVTQYVARDFEIRDAGQATKFVFLGTQRLAEITGTLDATAERIQRAPLAAGWNLLALAVSAPDIARQLGIGTEAIATAYRVRADGEYEALTASSPLAAGSLVWLLASAPAVLAVRGVYEPVEDSGIERTGFVPNARLEALVPDFAPAQPMTLWLYDALRARWRGRLPEPLNTLRDLPLLSRPGEALYARSAAPAELVVPPEVGRVRYYHPDHLGSSNTLTDQAGHVVEETLFYPFGHPRQRTPGTDFGLPSTNYLFSQKERDRESGLYYFETRFYLPEIGSFTSVDDVLRAAEAVSEPRGLNAYAYGLGNPGRFVDPSGKQWNTDFRYAGVQGMHVSGADSEDIAYYRDHGVFRNIPEDRPSLIEVMDTVIAQGHEQLEKGAVAVLERTERSGNPVIRFGGRVVAAGAATLHAALPESTGEAAVGAGAGALLSKGLSFGRKLWRARSARKAASKADSLSSQSIELGDTLPPSQVKGSASTGRSGAAAAGVSSSPRKRMGKFLFYKRTGETITEYSAKVKGTGKRVKYRVVKAYYEDVRSGVVDWVPQALVVE